LAYYCSTADAGSRLGLDSAQRSRAGTRLEGCIRRATIIIDQMFLAYGRDEPSKSTAESTLNGTASAGATTVTVTNGANFDASGFGNINGDSFQWTGKSTHQLTGVTGVSFDHATGVLVQQGAMAHVVREICADIASGLYLEDEATMQKSTDLRGSHLRERGEHCLIRLAHLGTA
tara:strand:- start:20581 stop:21105 length:525 start_codon:yes stop_codon:yes gene_type:complete